MLKLQLDYNPRQDLYFLRLPRTEGDAQEYMVEYGLDIFGPSLATDEAVLFTPQPYAAAAFGHCATPLARERLGYILTQIERSWAPSSDRHVAVPDDKELWPFQRASADYALRRKHTLIADQPGLGKTPIAIAIANEMQAERVLVVCPATIRYQWLRYAANWTTLPSATGQAIVSSGRGVSERVNWTVVSWDLVRSAGIWRALAKQQYDLLILDEAHYAKTIDAKRTRAVFGGGREQIATPLVERANRVLALTGTPLPNRPREAYVLARHLCWESIDFLSEVKFAERFNPIRKGVAPSGAIWTEEHIGRTAELQSRLRANFMVRHLKRDVMTQLKMPQFALVRVEETRAIRAALRAERLLDIDPEHLEGADAEVLGHIAAARRQMGIAMAPQVGDYAAMLLEGGEDKLVVFAWHTDVLDILCTRLAAYGVVRVDGHDSAVAKDRKVRQFIDHPGVHVIAGNILSLGTGTDGLQTVSNHALLAEADWVHGNNEQAFDRLDRGGQNRQVQGDIFVAPGSLAEKVLASALRKGQVTHKALDRRVA